MMRVLHLWDVAGVSCILSKYLSRIGVESRVIHRRSHDVVGFLDFYSQFSYSISGDVRKFALETIRLGRHADILHVHSLDNWLPLLRARLPNKPLLLHYHGDDIRYKQRSTRKHFYQMLADRVLVSTPDLLSYAARRAIWLPNPVDTDHFRPMPELRKKEALTFKMRYLDMQRASTILDSLNVEIVDRDRSPIPYKLMPAFMNQFRLYIDAKFERTALTSMSTTGLQALACGLTVIDWKNQHHTSLPDIHKPDRVVQKLLEIYESMLS
jgi:glycosyltransferase involved in cell wall biosynthesis